MQRRKLGTLALLAAAALTLAACTSAPLSGDGAATEPSGDGAGELIPVTVGALPIAPTAALQLGLDEGIFEAHGLDVTVEYGQGGAALLPAVSSGSIHFAIGNPLSVLIAVSQGLDMRLVAGYARIDDPPGGGMLVAADSGIETWRDLEGKTVAVNALNTQADLTIKASVDDDGGDSTAVTFTEIPFPDQLPQLEQGHIDAAWVPEPFLSAGIGSGAVMLGDPQWYIPRAYTLATFTSGAFADSEPEVVEAFVAAITEALAFAAGDEAVYRTAIADFTGMEQATADSIAIDDLTGELDRTPIEQVSELAYRYGYLEREPDLDLVIR
jgi:ABC-type nitrate/sulfonate/bicarbonate transport systems, periplasmic components